MRFLFSDEAGAQTLHLRGETYKYLVKVRRHKSGDTIFMRNKSDRKILYRYEIAAIESRRVTLVLCGSEEKIVDAKRRLHLGWCMIESRSIEKVLPSLNEMGAAKITFIECARSQRNVKLDFERFRRIVDASSQQCGRSTEMEFAVSDSVQTFLKEHKECVVFDFSAKKIEKSTIMETVLIGCEGGFSEEERAFFDKERIYSFDTPLVLRSESAALAVASTILL